MKLRSAYIQFSRVPQQKVFFHVVLDNRKVKNVNISEFISNPLEGLMFFCIPLSLSLFLSFSGKLKATKSLSDKLDSCRESVPIWTNYC